jgi:uncharacterized BrkB/YihY/UPF0761 family membrane protein
MSARQEGAGVTVVAVITLVFGLWWVFGELQDALNTIWGVTPRPGRRFLVNLRERFWSFTLVVGIGFLLLAALTSPAFRPGRGRHRSLPGSDHDWLGLRRRRFTGCDPALGLLLRADPLFSGPSSPRSGHAGGARVRCRPRRRCR